MRVGNRTAAIGAIVVSGVLYGMSFPPVAARFLAWVALVPALVVFNGGARRENRTVAGSASGAGWAGALLGWVGACLTVYWLPLAAVTYYEQSVVVGALLFAAVTLLMVVPYVAAWGWFHAWARARWPAWSPILSASAFVAAEYARSHVLGGNPWAIFGYSQASSSPMAQIAELTGVYGVSFILLLVNATLAELLCRGRSRVAVVAGTVAALVLIAGFGRHRLSHFGDLAAAATGRVAVVQGDLDLGSRWRHELYGKNLGLYLQATRQVLKESPDLVVWPETAMMFFVDREPLYRSSIASFFHGSAAQLLAGGPRYEDDGETRYFNSAFLLSASGTILDHYDKEKLLPFAERFPVGGSLVRRNFGRVREFTVGTRVAPIDTSLGRVGVVICNEAMYPEFARRRALDGAVILANLSNDTWIGDRGYSMMALDMAAYRAVENRRSMIRASTAGPSAVIAPSGKVRARTELFEPDTLVATIAARSELTFYSRFGDVFAWVCCAIALGAAAGPRLKRGRRLRRRN